MSIVYKNIIPLLEFIRIDKSYVVCHFRCKIKNKTIISTVPFEPYGGKIEFTWQEIVLHPLKSYNRYYHTPITIYSKDCRETIVLKAFNNISKHFIWNMEKQKYIYN